MQKSLTPEGNRSVILATTIGLAALLLVFGGAVSASCLGGALFGVAAGLLQRHSLRRHAVAYASSKTALEVRKVMVASRAGRLAVSLGWGCGIVLLVPSALFRPLELAPVSWLAGYLAFMSVRDVLAYSALHFVHQAVDLNVTGSEIEGKSNDEQRRSGDDDLPRAMAPSDLGPHTSRPVTPGWRFVSIDFEAAAVVLDGVNPWNFAHEWRPTGEAPITVAHPSYPSQRHSMSVYELDLPSRKLRFAAGEFSNGVWGFYLPE